MQRHPQPSVTGRRRTPRGGPHVAHGGPVFLCPQSGRSHFGGVCIGPGETSRRSIGCRETPGLWIAPARLSGQLGDECWRGRSSPARRFRDDSDCGPHPDGWARARRGFRPLGSARQARDGAVTLGRGSRRDDAQSARLKRAGRNAHDVEAVAGLELDDVLDSARDRADDPVQEDLVGEIHAGHVERHGGREVRCTAVVNRLGHALLGTRISAHPALRIDRARPQCPATCVGKPRVHAMHNGRRDPEAPVDATANTRVVIGSAAWRSRQRPRWRHRARAACRALLRARRARRSAGRRHRAARPADRRQPHPPDRDQARLPRPGHRAVAPSARASAAASPDDIDERPAR
jgi:hypothetical protein